MNPRFYVLMAFVTICDGIRYGLSFCKCLMINISYGVTALKGGSGRKRVSGAHRTG